MRLGLIIGLTLMGIAFIAAAAELAAQAQTSHFGILSFHEVLRVIVPGHLATLETGIERRLGSFFWDPVTVALLAFPGWMLFGVPGALIAWRYRRRSALLIDEQDDAPYSSYEDIVAAAEEADEIAGDDDGFPSKYRNFDEYDPGAANDESLNYIAEWEPADRLPDEAADLPGFLPPTGRPPPDGDDPDRDDKS